MLGESLQEAIGRRKELLLVGTEALADDGVCTLADDLDLVLGCADEDCHTLAVRVELDHVQVLVIDGATVEALNYSSAVIILALVSKAEMAGTVDQSELVGRGGVVSEVLLAVLRLFLCHADRVAQA